MNSSTALPEIRTIDMAISQDLLKQFIEEKIEQFGFKADDNILKIDLEGLPSIIPMKIKFKKEKEAGVISHSNAS